MMLPALLWYLLVSALGLLAFPIAYRMLPALPDRGYTAARALSLILWGFLFWLLASLGILTNDLGGLAFALLLLVGLSVWALRGPGLREIVKWLRVHRRLVVSVEILFALAFIAFVLFRAINPDITNTEKPMELAFINSILRSPTLPPRDPWLSGYAISYYYFGYVQVAMLAQLTGLSGGVAFNLGLALVFALTATGTYGLVYNLLALRRPKAKANLALALLGPLFVALLSNVEGFLRILHNRGVFWGRAAGGELTSRFWSWLDLAELSQPPLGSADTWVPQGFATGSWWWWRASRVIQDYDFLGNNKGDVISEFPFFAFALGDLHPHVLAIPFLYLVVALALNLFLHREHGQMRLFNLRLEISPLYFLFAALLLGGMAFLNVADFPFSVALFAAAYAFRRANKMGWRWARLADFISLGVVVGVSAIVLYLPFYISYSSQVSGLIPNLVYVTRGAHLWIVLGTLFLPICAYLLYLWRQQGDLDRLKKGVLLVLGILLVLWLFSLSLAAAMGLASEVSLQGLVAGLEAADLSTSSPSFWVLLGESLNRRIANVGGWGTLALLLTLVVVLIWPKNREQSAADSQRGLQPDTASHTFALLLVLVGLLVVLAPEFVFIRDQFGYRINTIFKFYFQAWLLLGLVAAFGTAVLLNELRGLAGWLYSLGLVVVLVVGLTYSVYRVADKVVVFQRQGSSLQLDGTQHDLYLSPDDRAAIAWLARAPVDTLAEAIGPQYSGYARISTHSGLPTVLGWPGHESQWRGGWEEIGSRQMDIERLYVTSNWAEAQEILDRYEIRYVYIGPLELSAYQVNQQKFATHLSPVFQQGTVTIYEVPSRESN